MDVDTLLSVLYNSYCVYEYLYNYFFLITVMCSTKVIITVFQYDYPCTAGTEYVQWCCTIEAPYTP